MLKPDIVSNEIWNKLDRYNRKKFIILNKKIKNHLKDIPKEEENRDEIIASNIALMFIWGDL